MKKLKQLVRNLLSIFHLDLIHEFSVVENDALIKKEFGEIWDIVKPYTEVSLERGFALYKSVEYIIKNNIKGDFVECGVANGGCAMIIAFTLKKLSIDGRKIYLYDTYEGMAEPSEFDKTEGNTINVQEKWKNNVSSEGGNNWMRFTLETVKENMQKTGFSESQIVYVKGMVEDTVPQTIPSEISLLRLDTDFYESTKHELEHLYPLLSKGGVLLLDDYGSWLGAKKAVDEYFINKPMLLNRVDRDGRVGIKM